MVPPSLPSPHFRMAKTEAFRRLPTAVVPENYELHLKPDLEKFTFTGRTSIRIRVSGTPPYLSPHLPPHPINPPPLIPPEIRTISLSVHVALKPHWRRKHFHLRWVHSLGVEGSLSPPHPGNCQLAKSLWLAGQYKEQLADGRKGTAQPPLERWSVQGHLPQNYIIKVHSPPSLLMGVDGRNSGAFCKTSVRSDRLYDYYIAWPIHYMPERSEFRPGPDRTEDVVGKEEFQRRSVC